MLASEERRDKQAGGTDIHGVGKMENVGCLLPQPPHTSNKHTHTLEGAEHTKPMR